MKDNQNNLYGLLEQIPTQKLDAMLLEELQNEQVDGDAVRVILRVLREREEDMPVVIDDAAEQAWQKYLDDTSVSQKPARKRRWILRAAAMAAVLCVVLLIGPMTANAERFYGMLARWTDSIFAFFDPNDKDTNSVAYEFKTDNPGLQQVYNAVVELGVTDPVVPMWLPEGFELVELDKVNALKHNGIIACFIGDEGYLTFQVDVFDENISRMYQKDESYIATHEKSGNEYIFMRNNDRWTVIWVKENIECVISFDCQEDMIHEIIQSIYEGKDD